MMYYENIQKAMGVEIPVSTEMSRAILQWNNLYINKAPWINRNTGVKSCGIPAAICSEVATAVTMESKIRITGSERAEFLDRAFKKIRNDIATYVEYACAGGGLVFKPYIAGNKIAIDCVQTNDFFPVAFNSDQKITAAIFPEYKQKGKWLFTRLEYHEYNEANSTYFIRNKAFKSKKAVVKINDIVNLGLEISLKEVPEWADLEPEVLLQNAECPLFAYFKIPVANNIDPKSPLGVSLYSRGINHIQDADEQFGAILWEYKSKETAIQAGSEFFEKDRNNKTILPKGKERLYHDLGDIAGAPFFNVFSPEIRDQSFFNGFNRILQRIEFNCHLAYGTLSDPQTVDKTAEEIKSSKQRSYSIVKAIQNSLNDAFEDLLNAMNAWVTIGNLAPTGTYNLSTDFDDSLIVDKKQEREEDRKDLAQGIMNPWEYRAKWYHEDSETAKKNVPQQAEVIE